jgi:hypothetical protein
VADALTAETHDYNRYARGCRCEVCRKAKATYVRELRAKATGRPVGLPRDEVELRPCGTVAAYSRHRDRGEYVDDACRDAHNDMMRDYHKRTRHQRAAERTARDLAVEALVHRHAQEYADLFAAALREEMSLIGGAR